LGVGVPDAARQDRACIEQLSVESDLKFQPIYLAACK
jgi:hypothetical protein